jgi:hypothetical protein
MKLKREQPIKEIIEAIEDVEFEEKIVFNQNFVSKP